MITKVIKALQEGGVSLLATRAVYTLRTFFKPRDTALWEFFHKLPKGLPVVEWSIRPIVPPTSVDIQLAERILTAFTLAIVHEKKYSKTGNEDLWDSIKKNKQSDFISAFSSGDPRTVAEYLCNMHRLGLTHGISDFGSKHLHTKEGSPLEQRMALIKDCLISLAEAVGIPLYDRDAIYKDADYLVKGIERELGIDIIPPDIDGGLIKAYIGGGHFSLRDIWAIYTASRIGQTVEKGSRICEIGAGIGKTALYAHRFGFRDYTIYDLPQTNVVQAWYLIKALPNASIQLYGEQAPVPDAIRILPYWEFIGNTKFDMVVNVDSFPEISKEIVTDYLKKIKCCASYFLSINKEDEGPYGTIHGSTTGRHCSVPRILHTIGGFKRIRRFPFCLRKNYIEELYKID